MVNVFSDGTGLGQKIRFHFEQNRPFFFSMVSTRSVLDFHSEVSATLKDGFVKIPDIIDSKL